MSNKIRSNLAWGLVYTLILALPTFAQIQTVRNSVDNSLDGGYWVQTVDFDQDGDIDLVAASLREGLKWYQNNGLGSFERRNIADFLGAWAIHANDFDGDGDLDVVAISPDLDETAWFERKPNGSFVKHVIDDSALEPHSVFSADMDGDGDIDVLVADWKSKQVLLWENRGLNRFRKRVLDNGLSSAHSVYAADLDGDGDMEALASGGGKTVYFRNNGDLNFKKIQVGSRGAFSVFAADIDGDGRLDILRNQRDNGDIDWFRNGGTGFSENTIKSGFGETWSIAAGDLDLDGDQDVVTAGFVPNRVSAWISDGNGSFSETVLDDDLVRPRCVSIADLDGDGDEDIVAISRTDRVVWYEVLGSPVVSTLSIQEPNGGESIEAGSDLTIRWNSAGVINNINLEYSLDAGANWQTIISNTSNTGNHTWSTPEVDSDLTLVRVSKAGDVAVQDESDTAFSLVKSNLTLTAPNGGENWFAGARHRITWSSSGPIETVDLEYSLDNGAAWSIIVENASNSGAFDWPLPGVQSSNALVRIMDAADGNPADVSDAVFSVSLPNLTLTTPNGGEAWFGGSSQTITWESSSVIEFVHLEYSLNDGGTWANITEDLPNSGSYVWNVPNEQSQSVRVRVSDAADGTPTDKSDAVFSIDPSSVTTISPNGGENWLGGSTQTVAWTTTGAIDVLNIEYSVDGGAEWRAIVARTPNTGSFEWTLPNLRTDTALLRISSVGDGAVLDVSDATFTITPSSLTLVSPNGGESLFGGTPYTITWTHVGSVDFVDLAYSVNGGAVWSPIANNIPNSGSYEWSVANMTATEVLVKVSHTANATLSDQSDAPFSIEGASLTLTTPNGGEGWTIGSTQTIAWQSSGKVEAVKLEYSINGGADWTEIVASTTNAGSYEWTIPNLPSNRVLAKISAALDSEPEDQSDAAFSIVKPAGTLTVTAPNGNEFWSGETTKKIQWKSTGLISLVKLEFSVDNGQSWLNLASDAPNNGQYDWKVLDIQSTQALIRVSDAASGEPSDVSDETFTIISSSLRLISPNGGEEWSGTTFQEVRWASTGVISQVKLEYSVNNGVNWQALAESTPNTGRYSWRVPNTPSRNVTVRISDVADASPMDQSDGTFTILDNPTDVEIVDGPGKVPDQFELFQNFPNPFNPTTTIRFAIPRNADVTLTVYNFLGQPVVTLLSGRFEAGEYKVEWNATEFPSGTYFYRIQAGQFIQTRRLTLLK